jgi:alanine racemase
MKQALARARVEIDLGALQRNGAAVARRAGVPLLPMIKADAYGVGARGALRALEVLEPWGYGVATVTEGEELRDLGVTRPIRTYRAHAQRASPLRSGFLWKSKPG